MICALVGLVLTQSAGIDLPERPPCPGWRALAQRVVTPSGIFRYMDGAGELYLAYGFKDVVVREYAKPGEPKIACELYRMPSSADAFGLLSQDRTGKSLRIGQGAVYGSGLLIAWQGTCFVRVLADRETPEAKRCVLQLARQIVKLCGPPGKPPAALSWLPKDGLDPLSVHFFHTHTCLNYFHFVATENILMLSAKTNAVLGAYSSPRAKSLVLVVGYPGAAEARAAWGQFRRKFLAGTRPVGRYSLVRLENGKWLAGTAAADRLYIVLESPTRAECTRLIKAAAG